MKMSPATGTPACAMARSPAATAAYGLLCLAAALVLVIVAGCKPRHGTSRPSQSAPGPDPAQIAAAKEALTRGMQEIAFGNLTTAHIGRQCVVIARRAEDPAGSNAAPPPLGMVLRLGQTTLYKGELQELSSDRLTVRAPYPTSGRYKTVEVLRSDIESVYLAR